MPDPNKKLYFIVRQLNTEIRKIYGSPGTDDILELQLFAIATISVAIYVVPKLPESQAKDTVEGFAGYVVTDLAKQWGLQQFKLGTVYQERYAEYSAALFRAWGAYTGASKVRLIDMLDAHVVGKPAGDPVRETHLDGLVIVYGGKIAPIF